jgi:hypothetical protein
MQLQRDGGRSVVQFPRAAWFCAVLFALLTLPAAGQDAASRVKAEVHRLQQSLKEHPIKSRELSEVVSSVDHDLTSATTALNAGRLYVAVEDLGRAMDLVDGLRRFVDKADAMTGGLPAFEAEWSETGKRISAILAETQSTGNGTAAAFEALTETARAESIPLLEGGRGFAVATGPRDGLFYVGQAEGEAKFAKFCSLLPADSNRKRPEMRSVLPELQALQEKTNAAFQPPRSIELHSRFITLNATLKLAEELDASGSYAGALFKYLDAVRNYGMLDAKPLAPSEKDQLRKDLAAARQKLDSSAGDNSIAQLLLERSESQLAALAPSEDEWRSSRVMLDRVLPAYFAALHSRPEQRQTPGKTVDITLVRWPYT